MDLGPFILTDCEHVSDCRKTQRHISSFPCSQSRVRSVWIYLIVGFILLRIWTCSSKCHSESTQHSQASRDWWSPAFPWGTGTRPWDINMRDICSRHKNVWYTQGEKETGSSPLCMGSHLGASGCRHSTSSGRSEWTSESQSIKMKESPKT